MKKLSIILLLCLITTSAFAQWNGVKPMLGEQINKAHLIGDPVAACFFLEDSGGQVFDLSGNGNTGTLAGSAPWEGGKFGTNPHYDGSSGRHRIEYSPELYSEKMTVSFWAKSDITNYVANAYVISMYDNVGDKRVWSVRVNSNTDNWALIVSEDGAGVVADNFDTGIAVTAECDYITFTWNNISRVAEFYKNGKYVTSETLLYSYSNQSSFITIGGLDVAGWFDGMVDLPMIYNRVLLASEIALLYREPFGMFEKDDVALLEAGVPVAGVVPTPYYYRGFIPLPFIFFTVYYLRRCKCAV
jgi:hypothetical protein